ncbi:MAG TPA: hypothetical protein VD833_19525 [Vicinamibacterales bacterium]|nr:hypothetical protein [Vicinamibacterales bacterium]
MSAKRRTLFLILCLATLAGACWQRCATTNEDRAYFSREGQGYRVELKGWRLPLVHDPVSLLLVRTYETTTTMNLPRIDGVIEAAELGLPAHWEGRVIITRQTMKIDLYQVEDHTRRPWSWNDEYTLVEKDSAGIR